MLLPEVPARLTRLVADCLEKAPLQRPGSLLEVGRRLVVRRLSDRHYQVELSAAERQELRDFIAGGLPKLARSRERRSCLLSTSATARSGWPTYRSPWPCRAYFNLQLDRAAHFM